MSSERLLVVFVGQSGSGKTTLARLLAETMSAVVFEQDTTLIEQRNRRSPAFLDKFDLEAADAYVSALLAGQPVTYMGYSQITRRRDTPIALLPRPIIIVEGVLAGHLRVVCEYPNTRQFWIETSQAEADARQLARVETEGWLAGMSRQEVLHRIASKHTQEAAIVEAQRAKCDFILDNSGTPVSADLVARVLALTASPHSVTTRAA
ncbi:MAG: AAA family ATPase [Anaerolineae bacterium]